MAPTTNSEEAAPLAGERRPQQQQLAAVGGKVGRRCQPTSAAHNSDNMAPSGTALRRRIRAGIAPTKDNLPPSNNKTRHRKQAAAALKKQQSANHQKK